MNAYFLSLTSAIFTMHSRKRHKQHLNYNNNKINKKEKNAIYGNNNPHG